MSSSRAHLLVLEAFYGGSHKHLLDLILSEYVSTCDFYQLITLPATKWHWRSRCSSLYFAQTIPQNHSFTKIFVTSSTNLAELIGLRPDLVSCEKVLYFHENQLTYPRLKTIERDYQHQYNEVISALTADLVIFNSKYNKNSFLDNCQSSLKQVPETDFQPIRDKISEKSCVLHVPINFTSLTSFDAHFSASEGQELKICWPHRWEHDKNPTLLKNILMELKSRGCNFRLSILGEQTKTVPPDLDEIKTQFGSQLDHFGFLPSKDDYYKVLSQCDIVLSTSNHEFQGLALIEAIHYNCYPLCPKRLVYPEYLPDKCLYTTQNQAVKFLQNACENVDSFRKRTFQVSLDQFSWQSLREKYALLLSRETSITDCFKVLNDN